MPDNIVIVASVVLVVLCCMYWWNVQKQNTGEQAKGTSAPDSLQDHGSECCGKHAVCEKQKLAEARMRTAQYFDDEELDRFSGTSAQDYNDEQVEEFRYIMYTMRQDEVSQWLECLDARGIELPDQLKEEAYSMMNENMQ